MFVYTPRQIPNRIFVVGCGGTGSRLVPLLAQFIKTVTIGQSPRGVVRDPVIFLVDDDVVEEKNLARQNFIDADVGKPKAVVLANRYSRAFGVNIIPMVQRISGQSTIRTPAGDPISSQNNMLIMCVDTAQARRDILYCWSRLDRVTHASDQQTFVIDAGNEDDFGQVRFFNLVALRGDRPDIAEAVASVPKLTPVSFEIPFLPFPVKYYSDLQDVTETSCADLDQTLAINAMMATMIIGVIQNVYYFKPFNYNCMRFSLKGGNSVVTNTVKYMMSTILIEGERWRPSYMVDQNGPVLIQRYADANIQELRDMGLAPDGTPLSTEDSDPEVSGPEVSDPVETPVAQEDALAWEEGEVSSVEELSQSVYDSDPSPVSIPEVVVVPRPSAAATPFATLPAGVPALVPIPRSR